MTTPLKMTDKARNACRGLAVSYSEFLKAHERFEAAPAYINDERRAEWARILSEYQRITEITLVDFETLRQVIQSAFEDREMAKRDPLLHKR